MSSNAKVDTSRDGVAKMMRVYSIKNFRIATFVKFTKPRCNRRSRTDQDDWTFGKETWGEKNEQSAENV